MPGERRARTRIREQDPGGPLLDYLAARFTYHDRDRWRELARQGRLFVNGEPADGETVLAPGDVLEFRTDPAEPEPPVETNVTVLFEDEAILAVNKPGDLPCHPGGRYFRNTLWALLRQKLPEGGPLFLLNRLDRETSGVVLAAKARWAAGAVGRQFQQKRVFKRYQVLVEGSFPEGLVEARGYLWDDPESAVRKRRRYGPGPPPKARGRKSPEACHTTIQGLGTFGGISLVEALPRTGRLHQIRATLHALGYPVVGDKLYGPDEGIFLRFIRGGLTPEDRGRLRLPRQALHAAELRIHHPATGSGLRLKARLPPDMRGLLDRTGGPRGISS
jgi:23S rRNA pseudouridine955/2504/2580 synthase/23S rRNA pseudouridine1911/1915/1917 synthase